IIYDMNFRFGVCCAALLFVTDSYIEFDKSLIYGQTDFDDKPAVYLGLYCDNGCRIYVSVPDSYNDMAKHIILQDTNNGVTKETNLLAVSQREGADSTKGFYTVDKGNTDVIFQNMNAHFATAPILIWVVRVDAPNIETAQVYDAHYTYRSPNGVVTVMNAAPYVLSTDTTGPMKVRVITAGYDTLDSSDNCIDVLRQDDSSSYRDIRIWIRNPLVTLSFDREAFPDTQISMLATPDSVNNLDLANPAFVTSPGYIGCDTKTPKPRTKNFRSSLYNSLPDYDLKGKSQYLIDLSSELDVDSSHAVNITMRK
ncbi:hypothetical protein PFISCL1PPCAC_18768, partial [Pristionchus fissidentatus]